MNSQSNKIHFHFTYTLLQKKYFLIISHGHNLAILILIVLIVTYTCIYSFGTLSDVMNTGLFIASLVSVRAGFLHFLLVACSKFKILQMLQFSNTPTQCRHEASSLPFTMGRFWHFVLHLKLYLGVILYITLALENRIEIFGPCQYCFV